MGEDQGKPSPCGKPAATVFVTDADSGQLCPEHERALKVLSKLSNMRVEAVARSRDHDNARAYQSNVMEAKTIRQHMIALREELRRHRADHGC